MQIRDFKSLSQAKEALGAKDAHLALYCAYKHILYGIKIVPNPLISRQNHLEFPCICSVMRLMIKNVVTRWDMRLILS